MMMMVQQGMKALSANLVNSTRIIWQYSERSRLAISSSMQTAIITVILSYGKHLSVMYGTGPLLTCADAKTSECTSIVGFRFWPRIETI